jgi:hypothetical protein
MSSTIDVVAFQSWHTTLLDVRGSDAGWLPNPVDAFERQAKAGKAWTIMVNRRVACIGGTARIWPGLGEAWMVASPLAREHPITLTRVTKRVIDHTMQSLSLRRLQAHVKTSDNRATRFATYLGFVREGTLRT